MVAAGIAGCVGNKGGLPDYCFVQSSQVIDAPKLYYNLYGHRKWSPDIRIGSYESIDEAVDVAKKIECPFR